MVVLDEKHIRSIEWTTLEQMNPSTGQVAFTAKPLVERVAYSLGGQA